ncbi:MAG: Gfo/Idh/MocA family oxidoreductase [Candidatus Coatesbacteria bacterium]|nr:MAG: Gfo/Idh/MocA family oxidoreductase [Candidatus Coatesbacteria bacterium]
MSSRAEAKVAVVGCGAMGKRHLAKLAGLVPPASLGFYDAQENVREEVGRQFPEAASFASWEDLLASDFDAVVVAAPAALHASLAGEALAAGKDVLVEKPLALKAAEASALVAQAEAAQAVLLVGHILLFDPAFEALQQAVAAGELGAVTYVTASRAKLGTIRTEEDVLFSLAAHDVAAAAWLLDRTPEAVSAVAVEARGAGVADAAFLTLLYGGGVAVHVDVSWLYPVDTRRFVVVGDKAMATVIQEGGGPGVLTLHRQGARNGPAGPEVYDDGAEVVALPTVDLVEAELRHFLARLADRGPSRAGARHGWEVVRILAAAQESAAAAGAPVPLEE